MDVRKGRWAIALLANVCITSGGCSASHSPRSAEAPNVQRSPTPPPTHDEVALYNDTSGTVYVAGCSGCGVSGDPVAPRAWLPLNLPPNSTQLRIRQSTGTTCMMIVDGVATGKPLVVNVSYSAASAC